MNILENRIILHRRHCEERRQYLAELQSLAQRLRADGSRLQAEIEEAVAVGDPTDAQPVLERHAKLARSLAAIEAQIVAAGDSLAAAERDLKRLELGAAQRADGAGPSDGRRPPRSSRPPRTVPGRGE